MAADTCPLCDAGGRAEHLKDGWRFCGHCGFAYLLDAVGTLVEWCTTQRSHPRGVWAIPATSTARGGGTPGATTTKRRQP